MKDFDHLMSVWQGQPKQDQLSVDDVLKQVKKGIRSITTEFQDPQALEIERIYVDAKFQNLQIGKQLLQFAINKAIENNCEYIWLGVWDANDRAIRFYERYGFQIFSSHQFMLGNDTQTDLLMKKPLLNSANRRNSKG
jgi:ribosomal protein S18 acetylase RimI-like enzyme